MAPDNIYAIVPINEVTQEMVDYCIQTSFTTLRKNLAGTHAILKWNAPTPTYLESYVQYSHAEILVYTNNLINGWIEAGIW
jgi:hypothetical protein